MKSGYLGTLAMLFLGAGWAAAQGPAPTAPGPLPSGVVVPPTAAMQPAPAACPPVLADGVVDGGGGPLWYASGDYLLWKVKNGSLPSTAGISPIGVANLPVSDTVLTAGGTPVPFNSRTAPVLVSTTTDATFGNGGKTDTGYQNGGRFTAGFWVDPDMTFGLEASFLFLEKGTDSFAAISGQAGSPFTANTGVTQTLYINTLTATDTTRVLTTTPQSAMNILLAGQVASRLSGSASNLLYGGEVNARSIFLRMGGTDVGCLAGFRYLTFKDELFLSNSVQLSGLQFNTVPPTNLSGLSFSSVDNTRVHNDFYGGQIGLDLNSQFGAFFVYARGKVALGNNHQVADVNSTTTTVSNGQTTTVGGGLLGAPGDNGRHTRDELSVIPEVDVKVGYQFTDWLRGYVGYGGIFLGNFARAGESVTTNTLNTNVTINNTTSNVNVAQPSFRFHNQDVWVQGVTFGFEARF